MEHPTLKNNPENIKLLCESLHFPISQGQAQQLSCYVRMLEQWNKAFNLTGYAAWQEIFEKLIIDSFYLNDFFITTLKSMIPISPEIWDLGAGAGLPGIPFRILNGNGNYTMVESREKRAAFLSIVLANISLKNTFIFRGRAEKFMGNKLADIVVSRAFMPPKNLLDFIENHLKQDGLIIFFSSEDWSAPKKDTWKDISTFPYVVGKNILKRENMIINMEHSLPLFSLEEKRFFRVLQKK